MQAKIFPAQIANAFSHRHLNLILFPTEKCNFRCTYCYEDFEVGRMRPEVISAIKSLLDRRMDELETLNLSWFGGEPLLAKDIVFALSEHVQQRVKPSLSYRANMTTNGYLLDIETASRLIALGVTFFQISLDGFEAQHDKTRRRADGFGTFDRIWDNLLTLRKLKLSFSVMLRVHFSPSNIAAIDDLIQAINREFAGDPRFTVYFKAIEKLGGSNDGEFTVFDEAEKARIKIALEQRLTSPLQIHKLDSEQYICYASIPNSLMIRADGSLGKCTVALSDERNRIGRIRPDGLIDIEQPLLRRWLRGFSNLDAQDLACPYSSMKKESSADAEQFVPLHQLKKGLHRANPESIAPCDDGERQAERLRDLASG